MVDAEFLMSTPAHHVPCHYPQLPMTELQKDDSNSAEDEEEEEQHEIAESRSPETGLEAIAE